MASFKIEGGYKLNGTITPQGAKNEVLQILCAVLLTPEKVTVQNVPDIIDVNKEEISYWKKYNSQNSPKKNLKNNNCEDLVNFITSDSIDYLEGSKKKYNFIFLDGSHSSDQVYKEISLALDILDKKGIIDNYNGFMQVLDNIKASDRDFYPTVDENFLPDGGVRIYATWSADLGDNSMEGIKAYEVFKFNENNKITEVDEYMDVSGLLNKIVELSVE